jgi:hypothetical protein
MAKLPAFRRMASASAAAAACSGALQARNAKQINAVRLLMKFHNNNLRPGRTSDFSYSNLGEQMAA